MKSFRLQIFAWIGVGTVFCLPMLMLPGAVNMFLALPGVSGEATSKTHPGEIEVVAWSWGMSNSGTTHLGSYSAGKANFQDISITKYLDTASTALMLHAANGDQFKTATLTVERADDSDYLSIAMSEVIVTSVSTGGSGGEDRLTENISLNFAAVTVTYTPTNGSGPRTFSWNIAASTAN